MDKKLKEHEAHFKPTADDGEKMLQIKEDMKVLMKNNNHIAEWFTAIDNKMATKTDGTVWMIGNGTDGGQPAQNNRTNYSSPIQVPGKSAGFIDCIYKGVLLLAD